MILQNVHACAANEQSTLRYQGEWVVVSFVGKKHRHCLEELFTHHCQVLVSMEFVQFVNPVSCFQGLAMNSRLLFVCFSKLEGHSKVVTHLLDGAQENHS